MNTHTAFWAANRSRLFPPTGETTRFGRARTVGQCCGKHIGILLLFATALSVGAGEAAFDPERVGALGGEASLVFEGNQTFSRNSILRVLGVAFEFHARAHPSAPLGDYVAWIEQTVLRSYQHGGFAKAAVRVQADRNAQRVVVHISEGPRFRCGEVKVSGLDPTLAQRLKDRLRTAADLLEAPKEAGLPGFSWPWKDRQPVPTDPPTRAAMEQSVRKALAELNRHQAEVRLELELDDSRLEAALLIEVQNPGVVGTLDRIEVTGLSANSRDDLLAFLGLRAGIALAGDVAADAVRRLHDSGRFREHQAKLVPLAEAGRFKLELAVVECANAPPLNRELTAEERAFLKLRDWVLQWQNRADDWVLEFEAKGTDRHHRIELVLGAAGLAIVHREPAVADPPAFSQALVATPEFVGFYSTPERTKLVGNRWRGQLYAFAGVNATPTEPTNGPSGLDMQLGAGWQAGSQSTPFALRLTLAPVAFVILAHPAHADCRVEQGVLSVRSHPDAEEAMELTADAASGRLIRYSVTSPAMPAHGTHWTLVLRSEEGALARVVREVAAGSASYVNAFDPQHPWSSCLASLGRTFQGLWQKEHAEILEKLSQKIPGGLTPEEMLGAVATLEELPWRELFAPFDRLTPTTPEPDEAEPFPLVLESPLTEAAASSDWVKLLGGLVLRANDASWPRGSWPWAVLRDATFLAAGRVDCVTNDLTSLSQSSEIGPLGCLVAAAAFGRFNPHLAVPFARQGAARSTMAAFQADLELLLRGETTGQQFLRTALQRVPRVKSQDLRAFLKLVGKENLPLIQDGLPALSTNPDQPPDETLRPVIERHWESDLHPRLLTASAERCLAASPEKAAARASSLMTEVAGWLQQAAAQHYPPAQILLSQFYLNGIGVIEDRAAAAALLRQAAEQNHPHAGCNLARLYRDGRGVPQDLPEAIRWFRKEAEAGCVHAMFDLAQVLLASAGASPEETDEAMRWLRESASHGFVQAQSRLGSLLSDGISIEPDYPEAWIWYTLAAAQGDRVASMDARRIERKLTADQLERARQRVEHLGKALKP